VGATPGPFAPTLLLVSEINACVAAAPTCTTALSNPCP
jgi:hypothetical protein